MAWQKVEYVIHSAWWRRPHHFNNRGILESSGSLSGTHHPVKVRSELIELISLRTSSWEANGEKKYRTEINARELQMLDSRGSMGDGGFGMTISELSTAVLASWG